jgi:hypothetical protein
MFKAWLRLNLSERKTASGWVIEQSRNYVIFIQDIEVKGAGNWGTLPSHSPNVKALKISTSI